MPNLGDYLGQLISEITIARMQADIEAMRVAELYANHPLLRNLPIPHFRLPNIELDVPVVISQMEEPPAGGLPRGTPTLESMRKVFDKVLTKQVREERIRLKPQQKKRLNSVLDRKMVTLRQPTETAFDVNRVADELSISAARTLMELERSVDPTRQAKLEDNLKEEARTELLKLRKPPERLQVLVTTSEIREAGPSENITRFHLKITEEAFEWTTIESEGRKQDRLTIE